MKSITLVAALSLVFVPQLAFASTDPNAGLEAAVRSAFADVPVMISIAKCESRFRQFASADIVLRGGPSGQYLGLFQIDENIHAAKALTMGHDIHLPEGNIAYARYLYSVSGSNPWKVCASRAQPSTEPPTASGALTLDMRVGMIGLQVQRLQQMLNEKGFAVASSGPGSPGSETTRFGALTREAIRRFQCAKQIVCEGDEATTGYGRVGPRTRAILNQ